MPRAVAEFIERRWSQLLGHIEAWRRGQAKSAEVLEFVRGLVQEWEHIPLDEKQIPYLPLERTFWASLNALHIRANADVPGAIVFEGGQRPLDFEAELDKDLDVLLTLLRERKPLPEGKYVGRRHLP
jgi:hypothetical protein